MNQATRTGVPLAAMPLALASASASGNSESASPWMSSVGARIRSSTVDGVERCSRSTAAWSPRPVAAIDWYARQTSGAKRPQVGSAAPPADSPKKVPAQPFLNTPSTGWPPSALGRKSRARSFQVICGTIASTRWS